MVIPSAVLRKGCRERNRRPGGHPPERENHGGIHVGAVDTLREDLKGKPAEFSDELESVCIRKMNESRKTPRLLSCATGRVAES